MDGYVNLISDQLHAWTNDHHLMLVFSLSQEDVETSLENLQVIDMMDISVLDEAEIDNGSIADCVEDEDNLQESLSDSRELVEREMQEFQSNFKNAVGTLAGSPGYILDVIIPQIA